MTSFDDMAEASTQINELKVENAKLDAQLKLLHTSQEPVPASAPSASPPKNSTTAAANNKSNGSNKRNSSGKTEGTIQRVDTD